MNVAEVTSKRTPNDDIPSQTSSLEADVREPERRSLRSAPVLITLATAAVAALLGWGMWSAYMGTPWTRDGTVRAYVVALAPEVAGHIAELHVVDNKYVRKGDLLMVIDPTNYDLAVKQGEAALQQAQASIQTNDAQMSVQQAQISANNALLDQAQAGLVFAQQQAARAQYLAAKGAGTVQNSEQFTSQLYQQQAAVKSAQANLQLAQRQIESLQAQRISAAATVAQARAQLEQAQVNLQRTRIVSPVDGYVTNLLAQLGDYINVGVNTISLVDANSFWIDAYFEETNLVHVAVGDPAQIKLMGHRDIIRGHVDGVARAINVANAQPNSQGVASVNPIFTWVRLAQRIPVRIHIDEVPPAILLAAGMTATVEVNSRTSAR